jgi:hypothetical protein
MEPNEQEVIIEEPTPRPFNEIPGLWLKIGHMNEDFFAAELPHTSVRNTIYSVLIYTAISMLMTVVSSLLGRLLASLGNATASQAAEYTAFLLPMTVSLCCFSLFLVPISFYANNGLTYAAAHIFGGKGSFNAQAYLSSLYFVPFGILMSVFALGSAIPVAGPFVTLVLALASYVFNVIFTVRIFKVVHNLTTGRAVAAALVPYLLLLIPLCVIATLALMGPGIGGVFSSITTPVP